MKKFFEEFRQFAMKGNVIDLAVAVIIGNAINKIVSSLVNNIFMPIIGLFIGRIDIGTLKLNIPSRLTGGTPICISYGSFLQSVLDFLTVAFCIFIMIKMIKKLSAFSFSKGKDTEETISEPVALKTEDLLVEIRDLLKEQSESKTQSDLPDDFDKKH
jgi:large conductance mechanosensitive channel